MTSAGRPPGSRSLPTALGAALATATASLWLTLPAQVLRLGETPAGLVDARDYDHLALSLARGRGFTYCWSDAEWRAPYERAPNRKEYATHLSLQGPCRPTAYRAPGYPGALAVVYRLWGRSFQAARLLGAVALALTGAVAAFLAVRRGGLLAAAVFALCFLADDQPRRLVGALMSEPLASLTVMLALAAHAALIDNPTPRRGVLAGALLGLLVLVRHFFSPLFALGLLGAAVAAVRSRTLRPSCLAYASAGLLTLVPWCVRNGLVLDAVMPLGTQGGHSLAGRYGEDDPQAARWNSGLVGRLWAERTGKSSDYPYGRLDRQMRISLAVEREVAIMGQEAFRAWLPRNWRRLPSLAWVSLRAHARGYGPVALAALACALAGLALRETRGLAALGLAPIATTALTVALTYEAHGRFGVPVRPVAFLLGSLTLAALPARLRARSPGSREDAPRP
jgi:hypothetical protein